MSGQRGNIRVFPCSATYTQSAGVPSIEYTPGAGSNKRSARCTLSA